MYDPIYENQTFILARYLRDVCVCMCIFLFVNLEQEVFGVFFFNLHC